MTVRVHSRVKTAKRMCTFIAERASTPLPAVDISYNGELCAAVCRETEMVTWELTSCNNYHIKKRVG